jgi:hypothetical protein
MESRQKRSLQAVGDETDEAYEGGRNATRSRVVPTLVTIDRLGLYLQ